MASQLLIYKTVVPLNRERHRETTVRRSTSFEFARNVNSVPLVDAEFPRAATEMPIVFAASETGTVCLALLGAARDRNAFVGADGTWQGRYVPAFLRRYPFVFAAQEGSSRLTLCIDENYEGLGTDGVGERMFDAAGSETAYTRQVLSFAEEYQVTYNRTQAFCDRIEELGLLEDSRIDYTLPDGSRGGVTGFRRVSEKALRELPGETVQSLFEDGHLALIYMHLISLNLADKLVSMSSIGPRPDPEAKVDAAEADQPAEATAE